MRSVFDTFLIRLIDLDTDRSWTDPFFFGFIAGALFWGMFVYWFFLSAFSFASEYDTQSFDVSSSCGIEEEPS